MATVSPRKLPTLEPNEWAAVDRVRHRVNESLLTALLHDVRNPLHVFSLHLGLLGERLQGACELDDGLRKTLDTLRAQVFAAESILGTFGEALGPLVPAEFPVEGAVLLGNVRQVVSFAARRASVQVSVREPSAPLALRGLEVGWVRLFLVAEVLDAIGECPEGAEIEIGLVERGDGLVARVGRRTTGRSEMAGVVEWVVPRA